MNIKRGFFLGMVVCLAWLAGAGGAFATSSSDFVVNWRWRNDDGNETNATWKAGESADIVVLPGDRIRLRICVFHVGDTAAERSSMLTFSTNQLVNVFNPFDYGWTNAPPAPDGKLALAMAASDHISTGASTIPDLLKTLEASTSDRYSTTYGAGRLIEAPANDAPYSAADTVNYNLEYCIMVTTNALPGKRYYLRPISAMSSGSGWPWLKVRLKGDCNEDGVVNAEDLGEVVSNFGQP